MTFKIRNYLPVHKQQSAEEKYDKMAMTKNGQKIILKRASKGDEDAVNYLFIRAERVLGNLFSNNYVHDKKDLSEAWQRFVELAYDVLMTTSYLNKNPDLKADGNWTIRSNGPLYSFNPEIFDKDPNVDLIDKFNYYYQQIMKTNISHQRELDRRDVTQNSRSMDAINPKTGKPKDYSFEDDSFDKSEQQESCLKKWAKFVKDPILKTKRYEDILIKGLVDGDVSKADLTTKINISVNSLKRQLDVLKDLFNQYDLSYSDLSFLIKNAGAAKLKSYFN